MMAHSMAGELIRVGVLMLGLWVQSALRVCNKITIEAYEITAKKRHQRKLQIYPKLVCPEWILLNLALWA